jgi:hypothetical protein
MNERTSSPAVVPPHQLLLPHVVYALLELGIQLDINASRLPEQERDSRRTWLRMIRELYLLEALSGPRSVVVTGEQGTGKTLLMRNLYPQVGDWLEDNVGRGEKNAVQIVERDGLNAPQGWVTFRQSGPEAVRLGALTRTKKFESADRDQWWALVRGEDVDVLLCTLEVPLGFWGVNDTGFVAPRP